MNIKDNKNGLACDAAQELLIKKDFESLAEAEAFALTEHLQRCGHCVAFQTNLANINQFIRVSAAENLAPDPAIREHVRNKIKPQRRTAAGLGEIWHAVLEVLNVKIPVYQAVMGMAVILAVFIMIDKLDARGDSEARKQITSREEQILVPKGTTTNMNHVAEIDSQKIGRTVADDSLLMKFMVTASGENI